MSQDKASQDKADLLRSLRIEQSDRSDAPTGVSTPVILAVASLCALAGAGVGWMLKPGKAPAAVASQQPAAATSPGQGAGQQIARSGLTASGYVVARLRATIAAEVTGRVLEVRIEEGQVVRKGDVLAVLDGQTARADAAAAETRAQSVQTTIAVAEANDAEARRALERARELAATGFFSDANLKTAQARADSTAAQVAQARAQAAAARTDANRAMVQLAKYEIRAPFSGVVIDKAAQPGEIISPLSAGGSFTRTGICTIVDMDSLEIEVDVNEAFIGQVRAGQKVEAVLDAYPDTVLPARVIATIPTAARDKATVRVRIGFETKDARILPDMAIKVTFLETASGEPG
jgi:RND family efflux transporter MFP subunit